MRCLADNYLVKDCRVRNLLVTIAGHPLILLQPPGWPTFQNLLPPPEGLYFAVTFWHLGRAVFGRIFGRDDFAGTIRSRSCGADSCRPFICHLTCHHRQSWQYFGVGGELVPWSRFNRICWQMVVSGKCRSISTGDRLV